jgi:hypothetical protein
MDPRLLLLAAAVALLPANGALAEGLTELPYTALQLSYTTIDIEDFEEDAAGPGISGLLAVGAGVFITAGYGTAKTRDFTADFGFGPMRGGIESTAMTLGVGYHYALNPTVDLVTAVSVLDAEADVTGDFAAFVEGDDAGWTARLGLRALVTPRIELTGAAEHTDIYDDTSTALSFGALYYPMSRFGVGAAYESGDDEKALTLSAHILF